MSVRKKLIATKRQFSLSKKQHQQVKNYFTEYCDSTTIHGFKYLGEQKRSIAEKIWWFTTILFSACILAYLVLDIYHKWYNSPVIVSFATEQTGIWELPFPAVTICPETKIRKSESNYTSLNMRRLNSMTETEKLELTYSSLICENTRHAYKLRQKFLDDSVLDFFDRVAPVIENVTLDCKWAGIPFFCPDLFKPILTDIGVCFTFNMMKWSEVYTEDVKQIKDYLMQNESSKWKLDEGYDPDVPLNTHPKRALYAGAKNGLEIMLVSYKDDIDYICGDSLQGYKVLLHHPAEVPRVGQNYFRVPLDQTVVGGITPNLMSTSDDLRGYKPATRLCFMSNERNLTYFKVYTQRNCEIECLTNFTMDVCDCVDFYMPRVNTTPICGPARKNCMNIADKFLRYRELVQSMKEIKNNQREFNNNTRNLGSKYLRKIIKMFQELEPASQSNSKNCGCLPACTTINYSVETSQTDWDWVQQFRGSSATKDFLEELYVDNEKTAHLSKLVVFFKDTQFIASERNELYGLPQFLANCGGLVGLCTGFSVLSLMELIYFLTLRWMCNIRLRRRKQRSEICSLP